jgi:hypothetical protein
MLAQLSMGKTDLPDCHSSRLQNSNADLLHMRDIPGFLFAE